MLYVAYGSNMNVEQMAYRCPSSNIVGTGKVRGWKLVFNTHADIIETCNDDDSVPVAIWNIADNDWDMLDMYEGYPIYYIKRKIDFEFDNGKTDAGIVYVMNDNMKGIYPPSDSYFNGIITGCYENGIDTEYLYDALVYSYENQTEK